MPRLTGELVKRPLDPNGEVVSGAKMSVFVAGTSTPAIAYSDNALTTPHASPIVADSAGTFPAVYVAAGTYKIALTTAADAALPGSPIDHVEVGANIDQIEITADGATAGQTVAEQLAKLITPTDFGALGGSTDDRTAILAAWATSHALMDRPHRAAGQLTVTNGLQVEWREGAWTYQTAYSNTGSFITNSQGPSSAASIIERVTFINPQIDGSLYPEPVQVTFGTGSSGTSAVLSSGASSEDDAYNGRILQVMDGSGAGFSAAIRDYVGSTRTASLSTAFLTAPSNGDDGRIGWNDNAFGFASGQSHIKIKGGHLVGYDAEKMVPAIGGGKGVNFEQGVTDGTVEGLTIRDMPTAGLFCAGKDGTAGNGEALRTVSIRFSDCDIENCGAAIVAGGINAAADPDGDAADSFGQVTNITYRNCGHAPWRVVGTDLQKSGIIALQEAQNWSFVSIRGHNASTYPNTSPGYPTDYAGRVGFGLSGNVGALVWGHGRNLRFHDIHHHGDLDAVFRCARPRALGDDAGPDARPDQCLDWRATDVNVYGAVAEVLAIDDNAAARVDEAEWTGRLQVVVTAATALCDPAMSAFDGIILDVTERGTNKRVIGTAADIIAEGNTFASFPAGTTDLTQRWRRVITLSDDAAVSFTPPQTFGILMFQSGTAELSGFLRFRTTNPAECALIGNYTVVNATTGVINGTTGTDARTTFSAHTDNKIYIENRRGGESTIYISFWPI